MLQNFNYISKVGLLLYDSCKFRKLEADILNLCIKREGQLIWIFRDTLESRFLYESVYRNLCPQGSKPGILYGLPKVHKADCPARPIMSAIDRYN